MAQPEQYHFTTVWHIEAPVVEVWDVIWGIEQWPNWWQGAFIEKTKTGADIWQDEYRLTWKSVLPYSLSFSMRLTEKNDHRLLKGVAYGELDGVGTWLFKETDTGTELTYLWEVTTRKRWMNWFSFLLKPIFQINHDVLMKRGEKGLKSILEQ